jgi:hypothetical protein
MRVKPGLALAATHARSNDTMYSDLLGWGHTSARSTSLQRTYFMTDVAEDTTQLQNAVRSFLSAMEPGESVAFASLVYFYNGRHDVR